MEDRHVLNALKSKGRFYEKFPGIHYDAVFAALVEDAYRRGLMEPDDLTVFGKPSAYSLADLMKKVKK